MEKMIAALLAPKYKAKASYKDLDDTKNFNAFGSASKHLLLKKSVLKI